MLKKIYIDGKTNSIHAMAAQKYFRKKIEIISCTDAARLFKITESNKDIYAAIIVIENSRSGSLLSNYTLLQKSKLKITGELYLETGKNNYTRFFVLQKESVSSPSGFNKASLYFEVDHYPGNLIKALSLISRYEINISKLQSRLVPERIWALGFYTDIEFNSPDKFEDAAKLLETVAESIHIYGTYKKGIPPF